MVWLLVADERSSGGIEHHPAQVFNANVILNNLWRMCKLPSLTFTGGMETGIKLWIAVDFWHFDKGYSKSIWHISGFHLACTFRPTQFTRWTMHWVCVFHFVTHTKKTHTQSMRARKWQSYCRYVRLKMCFISSFPTFNLLRVNECLCQMERSFGHSFL